MKGKRKKKNRNKWRIYEIVGEKGFLAYDAVFIRTKEIDEDKIMEMALAEYEEYHEGITERYNNGEVDFYFTEMFKDENVYGVCN